ncbi:hypothetical protein FF38_05937 [Lucilia cuprina]|uniref:Zasp-like motif domain-containing protein n=1 Tax=Lucilia cuprina TaxID=7375 RepID=A0A0L0CQ22_LUCCU|nr:hypothetical protein FF38_05937 [Lucilia cuprina]
MFILFLLLKAQCFDLVNRIKMAAVQRKLVHKQFNSPMGLYSQQNVKETLNRELKAFGTDGIEIDEQIARPLNLANSAVLRAVEEEEQMKCERQSRSRQRFYYQRPHTPVHQHQLEQIKTQYLSHQHDITIDRDTVLKINRLATRRNLHKREHSWPPTTMTATGCIVNNNELLKNVDEKGKILSLQQQQQQHIRSTSHDNALQFDETVCKRHGIDVIRKKFNSPTRIIEPTAQEVRQRREQQRKLQQQKQKQQQQKQQSQQQTRSRSDDAGSEVDCSGGGVAKNKPKQMINLLKHEELLRKNSPNKSATMTDTTANAQRTTNENDAVEKNNENLPERQIKNDKSTEMDCDKNLKNKEEVEDELFKTTTLPMAKGFSHPETKAADEDIGLVEPKRQYYEQLCSSRKWHSYENLLAAASGKPVLSKPLAPQMHKRQAHSLERGREARQHKQLPPQKPRISPKLQRRSMKLATEIKISYDADAQQHNIQVKSLNQPKKQQTAATVPTTTLDDLEHIPLPATPDKCRSVPVTVEQNGEQQNVVDAKTKSLKDQQIYDDSCIYLRSIDLQDNTVAYIPAAITIVPSPTEEIMQHWMESSNLKANIKGVNDIETAGCSNTASNDLKNEKNENLISMLKQESVKSVVKPEGIKQQQKHQQQHQQQQNDKHEAGVETKAETDTYVTRLPSTPNGIQLTRQTSVNTKRSSNNNKDNKISTTSAMTIETAKTHATLQQQHESQAPGVKHSNATATTECNKIAKEVDKPDQQGVYYTDGEFIYGPYDPYNGAPLANATVRSLEAEQQQKQQQQLHQESNQIKKDIEAETKTQHKNEIANLTAKYEYIQKSINEHLRQIDAYIENAKAALKSTIATGNKPESSFPSLPHISEKEQFLTSQPQIHYECNIKSPPNETPLKEILRKITNIMQEVKPLHRNEKPNKQETYMHETTIGNAQKDGEENMPIVDKVLMDLNMLTKHLTEFDKTTSQELKPIMEQLQQTPLNLQFETRPTATTASHVLITEETTNKENSLETAKNQQLKEAKTMQSPPTPPPLPPPPSSSMYKQVKPRKEHIGDEQLLATDKLITTAQIQSQQHTPVTSNFLQKEMTMSALTPKDDTTTTTATKDKMKNFVYDFITARHEQEQLVGQVIDTLEKLENETKENLVNIHVPPAHDDEQIKSNLNQQTPTSNTQTKKEEDKAIMQNCNISVLANASGKDACNHDNHDPKSTKGNESQLKLHIKDFADKIADKQFQKYDNQPPKKNTNDVVNTNSNNNKPGQRHHTTTVHEHNNKHISSCHQDDDVAIADEDDKDNKIKKMMEQEQHQEEEGDSNHSSASELSNTYKSSYELPSPYITVRQISWEDVQATTTQTTTNFQKQSEKVETATAAVSTPNHDIPTAQICTKSPVTFCATTATQASPVTTSGHVEMQSTTALKPRIQTRKQPSPPTHQQKQHDLTHITADEGRKYPAPLIEPHLPTRSTSPFGLNAIELPFKQRRSTSVSPTRLRKIRIAQDALDSSATRKYPSPLVEPHLPTRATSPFCLNTVEMKNVKRSASTSPKRIQHTQLRTSPKTVDEMAIRKYPAPLAEPQVPTRAASPFGLNAVDVFHLTRTTTPIPAHGLEVKYDEDEQEQDYKNDDDENKDKPISPIRKYPPALIEPHVPTRAASPFGLNVVDTKQKVQRHRTPSPARGHHYQHPHSHQAATLKSSSTATDSCNKTIAYVPQVEGHNIGLLVRSSTPAPYFYTESTSQTTRLQSEINATKTSYDYATMTARDISGNKYCEKNDMGRDAANENDYISVVVTDDDEATCDELQRINTISSTKQVKQPKMRNLNTIGTTATKTMDQPQKQHYAHQYASSSGPHMDVDVILLPTSVINRSFDNVSPRPYISIEGYKRVAWPPASEERIVREFTPQPQTQFPPAPGYNQQQQQQPAAQAAAAVPPTQEPNYYNNVQQHHAPINYNNTNNNNFARENNSPYKQTQNQTDYEAFPPQTPETPIILKDKQFSRLPSHEPHSVPYQYQQEQEHHQEQQYQPPQIPQQQQPQYQQPLYNQQNNPHHQHQHQQQYQPNPQNVAYPQQQQQQYQSNPQNVAYPQQHQQQPHYPHQEEHHQQQTLPGWKPIRPPQAKPETLFTGAYGVRETTPTVAPNPIYQQQYQNYHQQQQYRAPSYDNQQQQYQQPPQHQAQQQYPPQPQYQAQAPAQNQYQQQPHVGSQYQQPPQQQYQQPGQPAWAQQQQQQYQQPPWVQQQPPQQQHQQPQYQNSSINQYNQAPYHQQQPQQQNQFVPQTNQQQFNSYSQPQQQQHTVSHDQVDQQQHYQPQLPQEQRGASPGIITLRKEAPITQKPAPVYASQPAATSYRESSTDSLGGSSMRGDLKWPPPEYKEAAAKENEERRKLALGPVCRPRKVNRVSD